MFSASTPSQPNSGRAWMSGSCQERIIAVSSIQLSIARRTLTQYDLGHLKIVALSSGAKASHNTIAIRCLTVLAHLPLAFEPRESKAEAYDTSQHNLDERLRCIRQCPWLDFVCLLLSGKLSDAAAQPILVLHHLGPTISVHDRIVPCRHNFCVVGFRWIPVGRDVTLGSLEDHQCFVALDEVLPVRVGTRKMAFDDATRPFVLKDGR